MNHTHHSMPKSDQHLLYITSHNNINGYQIASIEVMRINEIIINR